MAITILQAIEDIVLIIIAYELVWFLQKISDKPKEEQEGARTTRRDVYGTFQNPLGDSYRKNTRNQYVPIKPGGKMLDGDEEDEV